jgi:hypothetical protein
MAEYIVVPGKIDIFLACNFAYSVYNTATPPVLVNVPIGTPTKLGESADEIHIAMEQQNYAVPGDRNGGRAGDPIEEQFMSQRASCNLELSIFDPEVANALMRAGGLMATPGRIPQSAVGGFLRKDRSYRLTFRATIDASRSVNFPCAIVQQAHILGGGTKFEMLRCSFSMHRAPSGHWGLADNNVNSKANVLFDRDMTGIPALT